MNEKDVKKMVKEGYGRAARSSCCGPSESEVRDCAEVSCCQGVNLDEISKRIGYADEELAEVPEGSNLGLGCGNPVALASVSRGETVLDLGSGAGFDCFLVANRVGETGKVIGVDMTPEMVEKARRNAEKGGYENVEFRLGEIEDLPVEDSSVDVVISNCVINLSPGKERVFKEAFRVLKPGGRMIISDMVLLKELPQFIKDSKRAYTGCVAGAVLKDEYLKLIEKAGFVNISILGETSFPVDVVVSDPAAQAFTENFNVPLEKAEEVFRSIASIKVRGEKPA
ncbi:MAG: arsenite S-adenosylmethyltransferase [Theionarchaea archaeon DG-70-1]|nr:MAG: arsenite S-adenosylmethyltransferase [Theionarchaea archaeon DG-70-1]